MNIATYYAEHSSVYPGCYEPPEMVETELAKLSTGRNSKKISFRVKDLPGHYQVEMIAPGYNKSDFIVYTEDHVLSVMAVDSDTCAFTSTEIGAVIQQHHFPCRCISQTIKLPDNIDPGFVSAEYKNGMLGFYFFKTKYTGDVQKTRVVVY